jgi:Protein of unknown function (DUF3800)
MGIVTITGVRKQIYCFADEAGNFDFKPRSISKNASKYFVLTTLTTNACGVGDALLDLRRHLTINGHHLPSHFHASEESQAIRDEVFGVLGQHDFRIDATVFEKSKTRPNIAEDVGYFYKLAWYMHLKHVAPAIGTLLHRPILVVAASLTTNQRKARFHEAVQSVAEQVYTPITTAMWASASDPCLWAADYCSWAIQRKWELGDTRSYDLIRDKIRSEFDVFRTGQTHYY